MKKTLVALAALAATGAFAQSSVTLSGTVDATVQYGSVDGGNTKTALGNSGLNSSEFRFSGTEDLGGGLKVGFALAAGVNNDSGAGAATNTSNQAAGATTGTGFNFNRMSLLKLSGSFGEIKAGRDYTPLFWTEAIYDPFGINGVGTSRAFNGGAAQFGSTAVRASNSIGYVSPNMGGFGVWAQLSMGENLSSAASNAAGDGVSIQATYNQGPLSLAAAYGKTNISAGVDAEGTNFGGTYDLGVATLNAYVQKNKLTGSHDVDGYLVGGTMPVGAGAVRASYSATDNGTAKSTQFALGYVYNFSKTVQAYATFASVSNDGGAAASLNGATGIANASSTGFDFGLSKKF